MSRTENIGSGWDHMLSAIVNCIKSKNTDLFNSCHELEAIQKLLKIPEIRQLTSDWILSLSERNNVSLKTSNEFRSIGNQLYKDIRGNGMKCVNFYTKAIFTAPKGSSELGMAYANRAAALMNLGYHKEAHSDCMTARLTNYPQSKLIKVLWRQASCSIELKDLNQLIRDIKEMNELLDKLDIRHLHVDMMQKLSLEHEKFQDNINPTTNENIDGESGSDKEKSMIERQTLRKGRFMVATEPISTDDLIVTEKAFAFIPVSHQFYENPIEQHCQNCAATNIIPYPCHTCKRATYCGLTCLSEHETIHRFECNGYKKHLWFEVGITHLALRTMLCGINELMTKIQHLHDTTPLLAWNELLLTVDESDFAYGTVLKLVTNFEKTDTDDFLGYVLTASMITMYLRNHTEFFQEMSKQFPKFMSVSSWEWEVFIGALITRHIGQLICNGHAISDFEINDFDSFTSSQCIAKGKLSQSIESQRIFTAIFPKISILNHSCDPNIRNRFNNTELMIYATRTINDGDEIFNCYGPNNKLNPRQERQNMLSQQYHFVCDCVPCQGTDEEYLNSHTYVCPCGGNVVVVSEETFWWRDYTGDNPPKNIVCSNCSSPLNFGWLLEFRLAVEEPDCAFNKLESVHSIENAVLKAISKYENSTKFMKGDINSQKLDMANMIIKYIVQYLNEPTFRLTKRMEENFNKIRNICRSSLCGTEYKFGRHSLEYMSSLASLMDIYAIFGRSDDNIINLADFDCLSDRTKNVFVNYYEENVASAK
ncbi:SET and MYND domain-containing protein 4 [Bradysia coprophila]|uniref:SET and MYND domain-containing protein 4 n=1 Tax=Bradysia coprophila TaxID=38358 RepID=UPI00187D9E1C|nr:SET and MYND domain-containing protein 4 [Bradysia coprophila]